MRNNYTDDELRERAQQLPDDEDNADMFLPIVCVAVLLQRSIITDSFAIVLQAQRPDFYIDDVPNPEPPNSGGLVVPERMLAIAALGLPRRGQE